MDILECSYADLIASKARDVFTLSYVAFPQGTAPETYGYHLYGANTLAYLRVLLDPVGNASDIADFEATYKAGASEVFSETEALIKSRVFITASGTKTTSSTGSLQTVLTYVVPSKQTFHILKWFAGRLNSGLAEIAIVQVQVDGTVVDGRSNQSLTGGPYFEGSYPFPLPIATAGQTVTVKLTPNALGSTLYGARILGELR